MKRIYALLLLLSWPTFIYSQVESDRSWVFDGSLDSLGIQNIGSPEDMDDGIHPKDAFIEPVFFHEASGIDEITLISNIPVSSLEIGSLITFKAESTNTGAVTLTIGQLSNVPVLKNGEELQDLDIIANQVVELIYTGNSFWMINTHDSQCPDGYFSINENYCIEINSHAPVNFFEAVSYCQENNARLCAWSEWGRACEELSDTLGNFLNDWEWVNASGDHGNGAKIVGNNNCASAWHGHAQLNSRRFRCCYTK